MGVRDPGTGSSGAGEPQNFGHNDEAAPVLLHFLNKFFFYHNRFRACVGFLNFFFLLCPFFCMGLSLFKTLLSVQLCCGSPL